MATYTVRGASHNIVYTYTTETGKRKQQWESYSTELEAVQRKLFIDTLQKTHSYDGIRKAAYEYRKKKALAAAAAKTARFAQPSTDDTRQFADEDNSLRTYRDFMEVFLPFYARKKRFSPNTYDNYTSTLRNHIYPYFGDRVMSTITAEDIDRFVDYLSRKHCQGSKSYGKRADETPCLSSSTIKKCYNVLVVGFETAKKWHYISEIPDTKPPTEKYKKRLAWEPATVFNVLDGLESNPMLHLGVHVAFICSLRAGEVAGIDISTLDLTEGSFWITQIVQRVSDESLKELPKEEIIRVFPKQIASARSSMILKTPKTDGSTRKQYLTGPLVQEIRHRLEEIESNKAFFGKDYHDYGLLFCQPDGRPVDPKWFNSAFKKWQRSMGIEKQSELQGLRKAGQMHKVRLTQNNYQLVAENSGQSPQVLMSNYNEALDSEKRDLARLVERDFYPGVISKDANDSLQTEQALSMLVEKIKDDPAACQQLLQLLLSHAG